MSFRTAVSSPSRIRVSPGSRPVSRGLPATAYRGRRIGYCKATTGYRFGPTPVGVGPSSTTSLVPSAGSQKWSGGSTQRPHSSPAGRAVRDQRDISLPNAVLAEEDEFDDTRLNLTTRPASASAASTTDALSDRGSDMTLPGRSKRRTNSFLDLDLSSPSASAAVAGGIAGKSFIANFKQVSLEGTKARGRYLATRHALEGVKQSRAEIAADGGRFAANIEQTKVQVGAMLADLRVDFESMMVVELECQEISQEVDDLLDNDAKMGALLAKMTRKLDVFQSTLGHF